MSTKRPQAFPSPQPSYAFHGSNSSHSKDNGSGGRTYHIPNYATRSENTYSSFSGRRPQTESGTSYANEKSRLISVSLDEDKGTKKVIVAIVFMFLIFVAVPVSMLLLTQPTSLLGLEFQRRREEWNQVWRDQQHQMEDRKQSDYDQAIAEKERRLEVLRHHEEQVESRESKKRDLQEEKNKGEEEIRRSWGLRWDKPQKGEHCMAYGTREYTARLRNAPIFSDWAGACSNTKVEINGITVSKPTFCEIRWPWGGIIGHWVMKQNEVDCTPYWGGFSDKGCVTASTNRQRVESRLWNIQNGNNWMKMCSTAPATVHGVHFDHPAYCDDRGIWGVYGIWEVEDLNC